MTQDMPDAGVLPALEAPLGVVVRIGWSLAAQFWRASTPADAPGRCGRCRLAWPCRAVRFAEEFLNSAVAPPGAAVDNRADPETCKDLNR